MNLRKPTTIAICLCLVLSLLISDTRPVEAEPILQYNAAFVRLTGFTNPLNLTSRAMIYKYIETNPGAHFRQICSELSISIGSAQYHIDRLVDGDLLESEKESKYRRFFVSNRFSAFEKTLISLLNRPTTRRIISFVSLNGGGSHIAIARKAGVSSQAVTWQVQLLIERGVIYSEHRETQTYYYTSEQADQALIDLGFNRNALGLD